MSPNGDTPAGYEPADLPEASTGDMPEEVTAEDEAAAALVADDAGGDPIEDDQP